MIEIANLFFDKDKRIITLNDKITNETCCQINSNLLQLIYEDDDKESQLKEYKRQPIHFYIDSYGGSSYDSWSTIGIMMNSKTPIHTYCMGYAMSAGFKIFLAGHERFMSKNAVFMFHQTATLTRGKLQDIIESVDEANNVYMQYVDFVAERTKIPVEKLREITKAKSDWFIRCEEAEKYGIAKIIN